MTDKATPIEYPHEIEENNPEKRGKMAGLGLTIGSYVVYPAHSRFTIVWFVEKYGELVRTEYSFVDAIKGLR